jgi:hypothetical protein
VCRLVCAVVNNVAVASRAQHHRTAGAEVRLGQVGVFGADRGQVVGVPAWGRAQHGQVGIAEYCPVAIPGGGMVGGGQPHQTTHFGGQFVGDAQGAQFVSARAALASSSSGSP